MQSRFASGLSTTSPTTTFTFDKSDRLKVSFGRYHTPINYWNTAFHHGQWLQTTISRPDADVRPPRARR